MVSPTKPKPDELEISLFGPGIGECIVLHMGNDEWAIVDSCFDEYRENPISIKYLREIGVDIDKQVKLVVVTHWHDDHIQGMAHVLQHASSAKFVCSGALRCEEFFQLVLTSRNVKCAARSSGICEFRRILEILDSRKGRAGNAGPDMWAFSNMRLYRQDDVSLYALSPSAQTYTDAQLKIGELLPKEGDQIKRLRSITPNDTSVVLRFNSEGQDIILGADLETGKDDRRGWRAIISENQYPENPGDVYKVSHHGSENADHDEIWSKLLCNSPVALVTPYARGTKSLPSEEDVNRLKSRTNNLYCTVWPSTQSPSKKHPTVERTLKEIATYRRKIRKVPGHIRLRMSMKKTSSTPTVELGNGALKMG